MNIKLVFVVGLMMATIGFVSAGAECFVNDKGLVEYSWENPVQIVENVEEESLAGNIIGTVIGAVIGMKFLPLFFNSSAELERDTAGDLDTSEEGLVGVFPLILLAVFVGAILGGVAI